MEAEIIDSRLVISLPLEEPRPSTSGKTLIVASSGGNVVTSATVNGQPVVVGVSAYIRKAAGA